MFDYTSQDDGGMVWGTVYKSKELQNQIDIEYMNIRSPPFLYVNRRRSLRPAILTFSARPLIDEITRLKGEYHGQLGLGILNASCLQPALNGFASELRRSGECEKFGNLRMD